MNRPETLTAEALTPETLTVVTLTLGSQMLALPASCLREILDPLPLTRVPGSGAFAPSVVNVRGSVVPLAELRTALGIPDGQSDTLKRVMVLDVTIDGELITVAVTADAVHEVTILQTKDIEHVPTSVTAWPADYVQGLYKGPNGFVLLPDLSTIFAAQCAKMAAA